MNTALMYGSNLLQDLVSSGVPLWKTSSAAERAVSDNGHIVFLAPGNNSMLDCSLFQMIEHLIASNFSFSCNYQGLIQVIRIKIAYAPG